MTDRGPAPSLDDKLVAVIATARAQLEAHVREINDLNVFPVPDGDTGTNLLQSVQAVEKAAHGLTGTSFDDRCEAIARAALLGARGNSGMILSQMVRGAADAIAERGLITPAAVIGALRGASDTAYRAVREPVEGTMLTVIRGLAEGAEASTATDVDTLLADALDTGRTTLAATTEMLPQLKAAGVVDSGAYGVLLLVEGIAAALAGHEIASAATTVATPTVIPDDHEPSAFRYCTSFVLEDARVELTDLETQLEALGDSLLVMGDRRQAKIHVHTDDPKQAIALGEAVGLVSGVNVDDMHRQEAARAQRIERSARAARAGATGAIDPTIPLSRATTAIISDTASDFPQDRMANNITLVPVPVSFGTEVFEDGGTQDHRAFYERLATGGVNATTAAPSMGDLVEIYRDVLDDHEFAVVLHMSSSFSSTADVARRAALEVDPDRIIVIETESVSFQLALLVLRVQAHLEHGTTIGGVEDLVDTFRRNQAMAFSVGTLEYLQRGGRVGKGKAMVGNLLGVQPVLEVTGGQVAPYGRARGPEKALGVLQTFVEERTEPDRPLRVAFADALAVDLVRELESLVLATRPRAIVEARAAIGPVVGTHIGAGAVAVACFHDPLDG